jgi:phage terminase small subunit
LKKLDLLLLEKLDIQEIMGEKKKEGVEELRREIIDIVRQEIMEKSRNTIERDIPVRIEVEKEERELQSLREEVSNLKEFIKLAVNTSLPFHVSPITQPDFKRLAGCIAPNVSKHTPVSTSKRPPIKLTSNTSTIKRVPKLYSG